MLKSIFVFMGLLFASFRVAYATEALPNGVGTAKVCFSDDDVTLKANDVVTIPASTILKDDGANKGRADDPTSWGAGLDAGVSPKAAIVTLAPVELRVPGRCGSVPVMMLTSPERPAKSQKAADGRLFVIDGIESYPIPVARPAVEFETMIKELAVHAILLSDVGIARPERNPPEPDEPTLAVECLQAARVLAATLHVGLGIPTKWKIDFGPVPATSAAVSCRTSAYDHVGVSVYWDSAAQPPTRTLTTIAEAASILTGATREEITAETTRCVDDALKGTTESAERNIRGVTIECGAFHHDGGAGNVDIYRRWGSEPARPAPTAAMLAAIETDSARLRAAKDPDSPEALAIAEAKPVDGADLALGTRKYDGKVIETSAMCLYADVGDYRCLVARGFSVFAKAIGPADIKARIEDECDTIAKVLSGSACHVKLHFRYVVADETDDVIDGCERRIVAHPPFIILIAPSPTPQHGRRHRR